jgi:hypothetical protein
MSFQLESISATGEHEYALVWRAEDGEEFSVTCNVDEGSPTGRPVEQITLIQPQPGNIFMRLGVDPRVLSAAVGAFHKARSERADLTRLGRLAGHSGPRGAGEDDLRGLEESNRP